MFQTKVVEKIKRQILCSMTSPPPENRIVYEIMWGNTAERGGAGHRRQNGACELHAGYPRLQKLTICSIYCFCAVIMGARERLIVAVYVHCLVCYTL